MKNYVLAALLIVFLASVVFADNLSMINTYVSKHPLGEDFKVSDATEGPVGSVVVPSPGTGKQGAQSIGTGLSHVTLESAKLLQIPLSYSYTYLDGLDLAVSVPYISLDPDAGSSESGIGDLYAGFKYGLMDDDIISAISVGLVFPTGKDKIMGSKNELDIIIDFPIETTLENFVLNADIGIAFTDLGSSIDDHTFKIACAASRSLSKNTGGSIDLIYQDNESSSSLLAALGLKYIMDSINSFTFVLGTDLHSSGLDLLLSVGYSRGL